MDDQQQSRWRPTRRQLLWAGVLAALAFLITVICGYLFGWKWTGLPKRTFWDWLDLLIVPIVPAIGGYLFTRSENRATQEAAERRALDDTLQAYLDGMSQLLTDKDRPLHRAQLGDSLSTVARARTLTVLSRLDHLRKRSVVQFLYESGLIGADHRVLNLSGADLHGADLSEANLSGADLSGADLSEADLSGADLRSADLSEADLNVADLRSADLRGAYLSGRVLLINADLSFADLSGADLSRAYLYRAVLRGADLSKADLSEAILDEATMPDGQKYEDWLKDKEGHGEDGHDSGPW